MRRGTGRYALAFALAAGALLTVALAATVPAGPTHDAAVVLRGADGEPLSGAIVWYEDADGNVVKAAPSGEGAYVLRRAPGGFLLHVQHEQGERTIEVRLSALESMVVVSLGEKQPRAEVEALAGTGNITEPVERRASESSGRRLRLAPPPPPPPPGTNDDCLGATSLDLLSGGSVDVTGSTIGATVDGAPLCGTNQTAPGVWYSFIGTGNVVTVSTCNQADFDTKITVFCGDCPESTSDCCFSNGSPGCDDSACESTVCGFDPFCCANTWDSICAGEAVGSCGSLCSSTLTCVDGLDDAPGCGGFTTELSFCAKAGAEYLVLVHGFSSAVGNFTLTVADSGTGCTPTVDCPVEPTGACCQCDGTAASCSVKTESDCADLGGEFLGDGTTCEALGEVVTVGSSPGLSIPDDTVPGASDTINMGMSFPIQDLDVSLDIAHTWVGDLCVTLQHDAGPPVTLIQRMNLAAGCDATGCCGCSSNDMNVTLDDEAAGSIENECTAGLTGSYQPDPDALSFFDGQSSAGTWTLTVNDNAGGDLGTFNAWSLSFTKPGTGLTACEEAFPNDPPSVQILQPDHDVTGLPSVNIPISIVFNSFDNDGLGQGVLHEEIKLQGCTIYDGDTYGDQDGLLSDEGIQLNKYKLCQFMAGCNFNILYYPQISVEATDCEGETGWASRIIRRRLLRSEVCR